jgi:Glycosyltransferase family 9 (heptosyltransferase)
VIMDLMSSKKLLVSTLTFGRLGNVTKLLTNIVPMLEHFSLTSNIAVTIVVRNNDPTVDVSDLITLINTLGAPGVEINLISGAPNTGFGLGHNENLRLHPSDYILVLNDDIGFPSLEWLPTGISMFDNDSRLALIGDDTNPQFLNPTFGNGVFPGRKYPLKYAEASVLLGRASLLQTVGMFDETFTWAMSEDSDLSLAVQSLGYRIAWISMPHEHWRSTSFNKLPHPVRSSIQEHNRARLFAKWGRTISNGVLGKHVLIDLWSDGVGDVFCALPHLLCELNRISPQKQSQFIVNTNHPDLVRSLLPSVVDVVSHPSTEEIIQSRQASGFASVRGLRSVNYSWPANIHSLLAGALSLPMADASSMALFSNKLRTTAELKSSVNIDGRYCVFHSEFTREGHEGRAMSPVLRVELLWAAARRFEKVVVVGREATSLVNRSELPENIVDLQGKLTLFDLISAISNATALVGIDSFPTHVAQALNVPSIVFFGSVHPYSRLWPTAPVWPLTAEVPCIGCYHLHLEPSVPFCLRRDQACQREVSSARIEKVFEQLIHSTIEASPMLTTRWHELHARQIELQVFHPSSSITTPQPIRPRGDGIATLFYELSDRIVDLYENQRRSPVVTALEQRVRELEARLASAQLDLAIAGGQRTLQSLRKRASRAVSIDLNELVARTIGCGFAKDDDQLDILSDDLDPQIYFHPIQLGPGQLSIRVESVADAPDVLELFWSNERDIFLQTNSARVPVGTRKRVDLIRIPNGIFPEQLWLRLDPLSKGGRIKLRATLLEHEIDNSLEPGS